MEASAVDYDELWQLINHVRCLRGHACGVIGVILVDMKRMPPRATFASTTHNILYNLLFVSRQGQGGLPK
jgi:hypothetical protein